MVPPTTRLLADGPVLVQPMLLDLSEYGGGCGVTEIENQHIRRHPGEARDLSELEIPSEMGWDDVHGKIG